MGRPWWVDRVAALEALPPLEGLPLGGLWRQREALQFVRENVDPRLLTLDLAALDGARAAWDRFELREQAVQAAFTRAGAHCATSLRTGALGPAAFRAAWQQLGFAHHADGAGTPADDFLDGLLHLSQLDRFEAPTPFALLNLAARASRIADFLAVTEPGAHDVVFDLGSGSGKLALTVAASTHTTVRGVEIQPAYADASRRSATWLGLGNVRIDTADVRDVDLSGGSIFFLYYPFHGEVAREMAARLGALARQKAVVIYAAGPELQFGEFFLAQVTAGALQTVGRRGEFNEVLHLTSAR